MHHPAGNGQSQSIAFAACRMAPEGFENVFQFAFRDARSLILHADPAALVGQCVDCHPQFALVRGVAQGVAQHILDGTMQELGNGAHLEAIFCIKPDTNAPGLSLEARIVNPFGQHQMWVAQAYPLRRPRQWLTSGGLGTMGFGVPAAIGAALAEPQRTVVCFTGDGSILMNIQELVTAAEQRVNVKIVLMNNATLGLVHQQQTLFYGQRLFASEFAAMLNTVPISH